MDKTTQRRPYPRGGRMAVESVAECPWNGWPNVHGIGGRITVESVAECDRNTQRTTHWVTLPHNEKLNPTR